MHPIVIEGGTGVAHSAQRRLQRMPLFLQVTHRRHYAYRCRGSACVQGGYKVTRAEAAGLLSHARGGQTAGTLACGCFVFRFVECFCGLLPPSLFGKACVRSTEAHRHFGTEQATGETQQALLRATLTWV